MSATYSNGREFWGVLTGETVKPLPPGSTIADAYAALSRLRTRRPADTVVYRHNERDPWLTHITDRQAPTQLEFDWKPA